MENSRLLQVVKAIDQANSEDPHTVLSGGVPQPYELLYSKWLTDWIKRLAAEPSEELLIAARGQHIQRWKIPRENFPMDRTGYLQWRESLKHIHAEKVSQIMKQAGYPDDSARKVERIILKKNIRDPEAQLVEDALCLVFLEHQFHDLAGKEPEEKMVDILRKSWRKMGEKGRAEALKLSFPPEEQRLIEKALSGAAG